MAEVTHAEVLKFDGTSTAFANYAEKATLWKKVATVGAGKKVAHLLLHMSDVARKVCMRVGKDVIGNSDGAEQILKISRECYAPDDIDIIFQDVAKFMYFRRLAQTMDTYLVEFDMLRLKAESRMLMGAGFPEEFVSVLCMQNAGLAENEKTAVLASLGNT